jgi:hypothetical protein
VSTTTVEPIFTNNAVTDTIGAARYLRISPHTLEIWRSDRRRARGPRWTLIGTAVRYSKESLDEYLRQQTVDPAVGPARGLMRRAGGPGMPKRVKTSVRNRKRRTA